MSSNHSENAPTREDLHALREQFERARDRYLLLFHSAPIGYFTLDANGVIIEVNSAGLELLQRRRRHVLHRALAEFVQPADIVAFNDCLANARSNDVRSTIELSLITTVHGEGPRVLLSCVRVPNPDGQTIHVTATDISELRRAHEAAARLNRTLEERVAQRTREAEERTERLHRLANELIRVEFSERRRVAQDIHDNLAQLLVAASLCANLARNRSSDPQAIEALDELLSIVHEAGDYSRSLIRQISPMALPGSPADALTRLCTEMSRRHGLTVHLNAPQALPGPEEHSIALYQSIRELLYNVVKHARTDEAWVDITVTPTDVVARVRDNGVGLASCSNSRESCSWDGIRERTAGLGGCFSVESRQGHGTECIVTLPHGAPQSWAVARQQSQPPEGRRQALRVLIVDDHPKVREGLKHRIALDPSLEVVGEAADGVEAVELVRTLNPDVVIMDINMPRMNGFEATRRIHSLSPKTTIVGLSIRDDSGTLNELRAAGAVGVVSKTDFPDDFTNQILLAARRDR